MCNSNLMDEMRVICQAGAADDPSSRAPDRFSCQVNEANEKRREDKVHGTTSTLSPGEMATTFHLSSLSLLFLPAWHVPGRATLASPRPD